MQAISRESPFRVHDAPLFPQPACMQRARNVNNRAAQPPHAVGGVWAFNLIAQERVIGSIGLRASRHLIGGAFTSLTGPGSKVCRDIRLNCWVFSILSVVSSPGQQ